MKQKSSPSPAHRGLRKQQQQHQLQHQQQQYQQDQQRRQHPQQQHPEAGSSRQQGQQQGQQRQQGQEQEQQPKQGLRCTSCNPFPVPFSSPASLASRPGSHSPSSPPPPPHHHRPSRVWPPSRRPLSESLISDRRRAAAFARRSLLPKRGRASSEQAWRGHGHHQRDRGQLGGAGQTTAVHQRHHPRATAADQRLGTRVPFPAALPPLPLLPWPPPPGLIPRSAPSLALVLSQTSLHLKYAAATIVAQERPQGIITCGSEDPTQLTPLPSPTHPPTPPSPKPIMVTASFHPGGIFRAQLPAVLQSAPRLSPPLPPCSGRCRERNQ